MYMQRDGKQCKVFAWKLMEVSHRSVALVEYPSVLKALPRARFKHFRGSHLNQMAVFRFVSTNAYVDIVKTEVTLFLLNNCDPGILYAGFASTLASYLITVTF